MEGIPEVPREPILQPGEGQKISLWPSLWLVERAIMRSLSATNKPMSLLVKDQTRELHHVANREIITKWPVERIKPSTPAFLIS